MIEEHKNILKDSIKDIFSLKEKFSDFEISSSFQLMISQLDLFKILASLVIGILGIGYINNTSLDSNFLLISIIFALTTLVLSISYTREVIDLQLKQNEKIGLGITTKADELLEIVLGAFKKDDSKIYFDYARERLKDKYPKPRLNWIGEIIIFTFYLSIGFLGFSFLALKFQIAPLSWQTLILLVGVYLISFKSWAIWLSEKLSINLK